MLSFFREKTPLEKLINDIDGPKVVKDFAARFGNINGHNLPTDELKKLTTCLYNKVLFLGQIQQDIIKFNDYTDKYFNYYHLLFNKLKACCRQLNGDTIDEIGLTTEVKHVITNYQLGQQDFDIANSSYQILSVLKAVITQAPNNKYPVTEYLATQEFKNYAKDQQKKLDEYLHEKILSDLTIEVAVKATLKFYRDGQNDKIKNQAKRVADGFINKDRPFYNRWFIRTDEQELHDVIKEWLKKRIPGDYTERSINNVRNEMEEVINQGQVRALFSLRGSDLYGKILTQNERNRQNLADWEKILWQRKLVEHLTYAFKGRDPFIAPHEDMARKVEKNLGLLGQVLLFTFGVLPPSSIFLSPVAKESFEKTPILSYIVLGSYYITYPVRFLFEYCVLVPLEAPFKLCNALYNSTFKSDEFDPALNIFQRLGVAITREDFLHSTTFHVKNEYKVELLGNPKDGQEITDEFSALGNIIKTDIKNARQIKTNSQVPVNNNSLQKELKYSNIAGSRFTAKVMLGKKQNPNNRNVNGIANNF